MNHTVQCKTLEDTLWIALSEGFTLVEMFDTYEPIENIIAEIDAASDFGHPCYVLVGNHIFNIMEAWDITSGCIPLA